MTDLVGGSEICDTLPAGACPIVLQHLYEQDQEEGEEEDGGLQDNADDVFGVYVVGHLILIIESRSKK